MFEEWVEDFEDLSLRRKKSADISPKFLDHQARIIINTFDEIIKALNEIYLDLNREYYQLTTLEKKQEIEARIIAFKSQAIHLIQRMNVKAELMLEDFQKSPFSPEMQKRLKQISEFTYEDLIKKLKEDDVEE